MSRWLLVGEGPSETGTADRCGFLAILLQQLAGDGGGLAKALSCPTWEPVGMPEVELHTGARLAAWVKLPPPDPKGMARVTARAARAAQILQCDAVVVLIDNDGEPWTKGKSRLGQLNDGLGGSAVPACAGVAKETLEAWLIADAEVLSPTAIRISKSPERIWGKRNDPNGEHPKQVLRRALGEAGVAYKGVLDSWALSRAATRAPRLREFCRQILGLLRDPQLCTPATPDGTGPDP